VSRGNRRNIKLKEAKQNAMNVTRVNFRPGLTAAAKSARLGTRNHVVEQNNLVKVLQTLFLVAKHVMLANIKKIKVKVYAKTVVLDLTKMNRVKHAQTKTNVNRVRLDNIKTLKEKQPVSLAAKARTASQMEKYPTRTKPVVLYPRMTRLSNAKKDFICGIDQTIPTTMNVVFVLWALFVTEKNLHLRCMN
jgi:hypothetical protein